MDRTFEIVVWSAGSMVNRAWFESEESAILHWSSILESDLLENGSMSALRINGKDVEYCYWRTNEDGRGGSWQFETPISSSRENGIMLRELSEKSVIQKIKHWSRNAWDFVIDCERALSECGVAEIPWFPSYKQTIYMAKLHKRFVDKDGIGAEIVRSDGGIFKESNESEPGAVYKDEAILNQLEVSKESPYRQKIIDRLCARGTPKK